MNEIEKDILRMEDELTQTESRLDVDTLDRIYADDIMVTAPIGTCVDKPAVMSEIRMAAEKAFIGRYHKHDLKVRAYGDTCVTNVWMKRNGHWQIVRAAYGQSSRRHAADLR